MPAEIVPPSGTVTFLFTDIEGSTPMWEANRRLMGAAVARHDVIVQGVVEEFEGYVFTTAGDSFAVAFPRAADAVAAARELQGRLAAEPWPEETPIRVRVGVHTGEAEERDGDFFGPAVNRAARVMSAAHAGQTLVSIATASLLDDAELLDLGSHQLRGLGTSEHLWQLGEGQFPPLRVQGGAIDHLPVAVTSFVGRRDDVARVSGFVDERRLVTLVGVGGIGKSRLAVEAARTLGSRFPDGLWWCDLQAVTDEEGFGHAVLDGVGGVAVQGLGPLDSALASVAHRQMLLVVDNCEHLLDECGELADRVAAQCPRVHVLATSREPLGVAGEQVIAVGSLDAGVELFVERAGDLDAGFDLRIGEDAQVAELCDRLDGMPLAIELAAARVRTMRPAELLERTNDRLRLLRGKRRRERHQTIEAMVQWSFDLLDEHEQAVFTRLSVFAGSFDLTAARSVCAHDGVDATDVEEAVDSLVDRSLVATVEDASVTRFRLLETLRAWGANWLATHGDLDLIRGEHCHYYSKLLARCGEVFWSADEASVWPVLRREWDNIRVALPDAIARRDAGAARGLADLGQWGIFAFRGEIGSWARDAVQRGAAENQAVENDLRGAWGLWAYFQLADHVEVDRATGAIVEDNWFGGRGTRVMAAFYAAQARGDVERANELTSKWLGQTAPNSVARGLAESHRAAFGVWLTPEPDTLEHARRANAILGQLGSPSLLSTWGRQPLAQALISSDPASALAELDQSTSEAATVDENHWSVISVDIWAAIAALQVGDEPRANRHLRHGIGNSIRRNLLGPLQTLLYVAAASLIRADHHQAAAVAFGAAEHTGHTGRSTHGVAEQARRDLAAALGEDLESCLQRGRDTELLEAAEETLHVLTEHT